MDTVERPGWFAQQVRVPVVGATQFFFFNERFGVVCVVFVDPSRNFDFTLTGRNDLTHLNLDDLRKLF